MWVKDSLGRFFSSNALDGLSNGEWIGDANCVSGMMVSRFAVICLLNYVQVHDVATTGHMTWDSACAIHYERSCQIRRALTTRSWFGECKIQWKSNFLLVLSKCIRDRGWIAARAAVV
jgi:hypothetical protein